MGPRLSMTGFLKALGPGLLLAGAAIGVSHLVQATRAGADYRFGMLWLLVLACMTKYPFLEFGPRYVAATGETLIEGYKRLGAWALWVVLIITVGSMFIVTAAVTFVTVDLASHVFAGVLPFALTPTYWSLVVFGVCMVVLLIGRYPLLDFVMKIIMAVLLVSTVAAVVIAVVQTPLAPVASGSSKLWSAAGFAFILAFMGWMPIPIDAAIWHSIWIGERRIQTKHQSTFKECLADYNLGYVLAGVVGIAFLSLGALVMYGSGQKFEPGPGAFAAQLISMYGRTLGDWSEPIISIAALTTMFSTTLVVLDAFPRVVQRLTTALIPVPALHRSAKVLYAFWVALLAIVATLVIARFIGNMRVLVDIATTLSFLTAPVLAFINYRVVMGDNMPREARPGLLLRSLSLASIGFLSVFSATYLYVRFVAS
jgi:Mn2+/Fe2+ NRAMP family transporter